jgi:hypothetical protein
VNRLAPGRFVVELVLAVLLEEVLLEEPPQAARPRHAAMAMTSTVRMVALGLRRCESMGIALLVSMVRLIGVSAAAGSE